MISYALSVISDRLQALTRALDSDPTLPGKLLVYDGPRPPAGGAPDAASSVLATLVFPRPSLNNVTTNVLTLLNPPPTMVTATGLATWARMSSGSDQFVADMDVGTDADTDVEVVIRKADNSPADTTNLYAGGEFSVSLARLVDA